MSSHDRLLRSSVRAGRRAYEVVPLHQGLSIAHGRNEHGAIVGDISVISSPTRAAIARDGRILEIGTLGGSFSTARAINNRGDIVGAALTGGDAAHHGFLYSGGTMMDLNDLLLDSGWEVIHALHIDDSGAVLAIGSRGDGDRVVLLVPLTP
jgi:probable HAF family extracellular repeat protein